nr:hypothetical protein Iba_chr08aCG1570 [Ipomoea batatas]
MTREDYERLDLNPRQDLASPLTALAFFSAALDLYRDELGAFPDEIARTAGMMAFSDAQNGFWRHGMLVIMVIETVPGPDVHILPPRRTPREVASILAMEDTNLAVSGGTDRPPPTAGIGLELTDFNGLPERDISMLKKEEVESEDNIDESCCVCLEEFKVGENIEFGCFRKSLDCINEGKRQSMILSFLAAVNV